MATLNLPTVDDSSAYRFEVKLDGVLYRFLMTWNDRADAWYMTITDTDDDPIVSGVKVVSDWPLLVGVADARRPPGEVLAIDSTGAGDPGLTDLGGRVTLVYHEDG